MACIKIAGIVVLRVKLQERGNTKSISGLYRNLKRQGKVGVKLPVPKYIPKPYEQMDHPGKSVQIDVKYVPAACLVGDAVTDAAENGGYFCQFTVIECVQTDKGSEFVNQPSSSVAPPPVCILEQRVQSFPYASPQQAFTKAGPYRLCSVLIPPPISE